MENLVALISYNSEASQDLWRVEQSSFFIKREKEALGILLSVDTLNR